MALNDHPYPFTPTFTCSYIRFFHHQHKQGDTVMQWQSPDRKKVPDSLPCLGVFPMSVWAG